jgi:hypothetical protein
MGEPCRHSRNNLSRRNLMMGAAALFAGDSFRLAPARADQSAAGTVPKNGVAPETGLDQRRDGNPQVENGKDRCAVSLPRGPVPGTRLTQDFVREIGRFAYVWAWPMVNIYNRYISFKRVPRALLIGGIAPAAPINRLAMLHDYIDWRQRYIACPSQDLIYGFGILDLGREPVVVQVPDFGERFWVYQATDLRTDGFADLGAMYGTEPGFYLLVGPDWQGKPPEGIAATFRAATNIATIIPRVFQEDDHTDNMALQPLIQKITAYPASEFDNTTKTEDWTDVASIPWFKLGDEEWNWVDPATFFDVLPEVLAAARPLPGEEALYALVRSVIDASNSDQTLHQVLKEAAAEADQTLVKPLLEFRNFGIPLPHNWTTVVNSAEFGTDYYTRTAVAKSNIFINRPRETRYYYQDLDSDGIRLTGARRYTVTFNKDQLPPVKGFWSITLYNKYHFFAPNELNRFSLGTRSKALLYAPDGSLTIYVQNERPSGDVVSNWLPAPGDEFSLYIRAYWPLDPINEGRWTPPPVTPAN